MVSEKEFGVTKKGEKAERFILHNNNGMEAVVSDYGALLLSLSVPDREGHFDDVVLGCRTLAEYEENDSYLGATVGRNANRIGGARFLLNGKEVRLTPNEGENNLHSGPNGYQERMWDAHTQEKASESSVRFSLFSPDGDQGFPGNLFVSVTYTLTDQNALVLTYEAKTDADTVVNLTNHSYFNLAGQKSHSISDHDLQMDAAFYLRTDQAFIPTGELVPVAGTPFDFRKGKPIGRDLCSPDPDLLAAGGYDHNFVLKKEEPLTLAATLSHKGSGRRMQVYTDLPGLQVYTANSLNEHLTGKDGRPFKKHQGICFESQYFPNAVNTKDFESPVLKAGKTRKKTTEFRFDVMEG